MEFNVKFIANYQAGYYKVTISLIYLEVCLKYNRTQIEIK